MITLPKLLFFSALILFSTIGVVALFKSTEKKHESIIQEASLIHSPIEIEIDQDIEDSTLISSVSTTIASDEFVPTLEPTDTPSKTEIVSNDTPKKEKITVQEPPEADRINEFFNLKDPKFPIVETITYKSRVSWQKGRPAWLSDYANHFKTSRHFIARSLNGKPDYIKQDLAEGARFNILSPDKKIQFHLIIDTSRCKMWFYYHDLDANEKVLVKTYRLGLGRMDHTKISGLLTPLGIYSLGSRIAVYNPKMMGTHNGVKTEMIRLFGTRWIPFEKEISATTAPAKGFGIHGLPWIMKNGTLMEDIESLGKYESDGCIRMGAADIEEIYSIIITRPTTVEIVKDFFDAENKNQRF